MIRKNIGANIIGRIWGVISVYLFIPLYLQFLGVEAYGLVGFYSTLMGVLAFADMGFTATLNREMARLSVHKDGAKEMNDVLRTYEFVYLCISLSVAVIIWGLAPLIAAHWLNTMTLQAGEITTAIRLMGIAIALQLPSGLYIGGLMGLQKQILTNSIQIAWGAFRGIGAVLVLWLFSPTIFAFLLWQLLSNIFYLLAVRQSLWHILSSNAVQPQFKWLVFRNTWRYATGMAGMAVLSTILMQTDKLAVSKMMSLEMLGYYTLACALATAPLMLASPIATAVFPRLTGLVSTGDTVGLSRLYHRTCEFVSVAIIPAGLTLALFAGDFILAWTGSLAASQQAGLVAAFLVVGQLMQAITLVPYYLAMAHGNIRIVLYVGIVSVVLITPLLIILILKYGVVGAGISWVVMNICTLPPYMYFLHRRLLPGEFRRWCLRDVGLPLLVALPCVLLGYWLLPNTSSRLLTFVFIGLVWGVAVITSAFTVPELRREFRKQLLKRIAMLSNTYR